MLYSKFHFNGFHDSVHIYNIAEIIGPYYYSFIFVGRDVAYPHCVQEIDTA